MKGIRLAVALMGAALLGAVTSLAVVPAFAQTLLSPKTVVISPDGKVISESGQKEVILSGENLAVRVERSESGVVVGVLVAKVDGRWVPVQLSDFNALAR